MFFKHTWHGFTKSIDPTMIAAMCTCWRFIHLHPICVALIILIPIPSLPNLSVQLDDWVLCRIYKKASHAPPMAVPPLSDHELLDEPCGFDENPYAATSAAMLLQGASFPALHAASAGAQRMPRIPSFSELFNDPSLLAHFFEEGGMQQDMARLGNHQQQQHAPLLGRPVTSQLLVNNGNGNSLSGGQIPQLDPPPASTSAFGDGAAGNKRKRSSETSTTSASALSIQQQASAAKKPNGSYFGATTTFQIGNGLQGSSLGHQMLLHSSNMGMN
jgi:hypothetical protein